MASIRIEGLAKTHRGGVRALRSVDVEIADGEFVTFVGPSGCGKSTTLNLIAGLDVPTAGRVLVGGDDVTAKSPRERDLAMVFQSYALYPHLTVRRNLAFPLEAAGMARDAISDRVRETAELLGLDPLLERRPRELSGGQRQRVALGRALVRRPRAFLFDEPLSNLDAALRGQVRGEIKKLHERLGATFVYVTHDQTEAMTLSDRVVVLRDGAVEQIGPPGEIYERPANEFVASFFGSPPINLVPPAALGLAPASCARAGIRPEHLAVSPAGSLRGTVWLVEPLGAETLVTVDVSGVRLAARAPAGFSAGTGDPIALAPALERVLRFDAAGRRIASGT